MMKKVKSRYTYILLVVNVVITTIIIVSYIAWQRGLLKEANTNAMPVIKDVIILRTYWGYRGQIVNSTGESLSNVDISTSPTRVPKYGYRKITKSHVGKGDFCHVYFDKNKLYLSFYKDGYKSIINKEITPKEFKIPSNVSMTEQVLKKLLQFEKIEMEKIKK
jgi:hypothetical protein